MSFFKQMEWKKILHKRSFTIHILDICLQIIVKSYCGCHLTEPGSSSLLYSVYFNATGSDTLAPFTMLFGCGDPAPVLRLRLCVNLSERRGVKFYSSPDTPLEVASEALMAELCSTGNFPRWMRGSATCYWTENNNMLERTTHQALNAFFSPFKNWCGSRRGELDERFHWRSLSNDCLRVQSGFLYDRRRGRERGKQRSCLLREVLEEQSEILVCIQSWY